MRWGGLLPRFPHSSAALCRERRLADVHAGRHDSFWGVCVWGFAIVWSGHDEDSNKACAQKYKASHHVHTDAIKMTAVKWSAACWGWGGGIKTSTQLRRTAANSWSSPPLHKTDVFGLIFPRCGVTSSADGSASDLVHSQRAQMKGWTARLTSHKGEGDFKLTRRRAYTILAGNALDAGLQNRFKDGCTNCCVKDKTVMRQSLLGMSQEGNSNS